MNSLSILFQVKNIKPRFQTIFQTQYAGFVLTYGVNADTLIVIFFENFFAVICGYMFSKTKNGRRKRGGKSSTWHELLLKHYSKNNCCHWCGIKTVISKTNIQEDNTATLDHLFSNYDIRRMIEGANTKVVLSCYRCNQKRCQQEEKKVRPQLYDMRYNRVFIIDLLKGGEVPNHLFQTTHIGLTPILKRHYHHIEKDSLQTKSGLLNIKNTKPP